MARSTCQPFQEGNRGCVLPSVYGGAAPWQASSSVPPPAAPPERSSSLLPGRSATEARALKVHSEAERRRRERINAHLATMRRMIPDTKQMDKATLLATVVNQLRHLKRRASQGTAQAQPISIIIPAEANGVTVDCYTGAGATTPADERRTVTCIQASVSCDDRPGLLADIAAAVRRLGLRAVRADVASLGGRTRCSFLLCKEEDGGGDGGPMSDGAKKEKKALELEEAVRQALAGAAFAEVARGRSSSCSSRSNRQRNLEPRFL